MSELIINTDVLTDTEKAIAEFLAAKVRQTEEEKKAKKPWKPKIGERYYTLGSGGIATVTKWGDDNVDFKSFAIGNCFKTKEEVDFHKEHLKVIAELRRFAKENNTSNFDIINVNTPKYYLYYDLVNDEIKVDCFMRFIEHGVQFDTKDNAKAAIKEIGKERLKKYYFCIPGDK